MTKQNGKRSHTSQPSLYQIRIEGYLDPQWTGWFSGLTVTLKENGYTLLTGPVADQAALFGLLKKIRDLGMSLVSINRVDPSKPDISAKTSEKEKCIERKNANPS
jgi:hypothetical protein